MDAEPITIATAGWSIARDVAEAFAAEGSGLARYASVFSGVEVNSSFYRRHRPSTWQGWHDAVPEDFRFAVKLPKVISHELRLADVAGELDILIADTAPLAGKLGPLLVQLPPSLPFAEERDRRFFGALRERFAGRVVLEPRHASWATDAALAMLEAFDIGLVHADPQLPELRAVLPNDRVDYLRLHGSPKVYYSEYGSDALQHYVGLLRPGSWCVFDNTASGAALRNALALRGILHGRLSSNATGFVGAS